MPLVAYDASFVLDGPKGVVGREHVNLRASSPTAQYWCSHTTTVMGPDDVPWSPEACQPHRGCFETE